MGWFPGDLVRVRPLKLAAWASERRFAGGFGCAAFVSTGGGDAVSGQAGSLVPLRGWKTACRVVGPTLARWLNMCFPSLVISLL